VGEAAYVGNRAVRFLTNEDINAAPAGGGNAGRPLFIQFGKNWGGVNCLCPDTPSYYNALQSKLTRRFGGSSFLGLSYTLSKAVNSIDNEEVSGTLASTAASCFGRTRQLRIETKRSPAMTARITFQFTEGTSYRSGRKGVGPGTGYWERLPATGK